MSENSFTRTPDLTVIIAMLPEIDGFPTACWLCGESLPDEVDHAVVRLWAKRESGEIGEICLNCGRQHAPKLAALVSVISCRMANYLYFAHMGVDPLWNRRVFSAVSDFQIQTFKSGFDTIKRLIDAGRSHEEIMALLAQNNRQTCLNLMMKN